MLRITCIIHSLSGGGAERLMAGLASRLAARHEVTLLTLDDPATDRYPVDAKVARVGLSLMAESRSLWSAVGNNRRRIHSLRQAVRSSRPDVVLSFCDKTNVLALAACRPLGVPVVVSERTDPRHQKIGMVWSVLRRLNYPHAAGAIALTEGAATCVDRWTGKRSAIIPSAVDPPKPESAAPRAIHDRLPRDQAFQWLAIGRLSPEKAFERAIEAFAKLAPDYPDWSLALAGEGPQRDQLQRLIDRHAVADRVRLLGWVTDVPSLLSTGDAFVLTSRYEGFPASLLEAMAAGLPCVAVDCESGPAEIIRHQQNGLLVPQDDPDALGVAMRQLMDAPELRRRLGSEARHVVETFGWDAMVAAHERVLEEAISRRRSQPPWR